MKSNWKRTFSLIVYRHYLNGLEEVRGEKEKLELQNRKEGNVKSKRWKFTKRQKAVLKRATGGRTSVFTSDYCSPVRKRRRRRGGRQMGGWNTTRKNSRNKEEFERSCSSAKWAWTQREWRKAAAEGVGKQTVWSRLMSRHETEWQSEGGN